MRREICLMQPVVAFPGRDRQLFGQAGDLAGGMLIRDRARDQVQVLVIKRGQLDRLLPVTIGVVGGGDLIGVAFQGDDPHGGSFLGQLNGPLMAGQDVLGHRTSWAAWGIFRQQGPEVSYLPEFAGDFPFMLAEQPVVDRILKQPGGAHIRADNGADGPLRASQERLAFLVQALREDHFVAAELPVTASGAALDGSGGNRHRRRGGQPSGPAH